MRSTCKADSRLSICTDFLILSKAVLPLSGHTLPLSEKAQYQHHSLMNGVVFVGELLEEYASQAQLSGGCIKVDSHQFAQMGGFLIGAVELMGGLSLLINQTRTQGGRHA